MNNQTVNDGHGINLSDYGIEGDFKGRLPDVHINADQGVYVDIKNPGIFWFKNINVSSIPGEINLHAQSNQT